MEWTEFCGKVSRLFEPWKTKLQFDYDDQKITYIIAKQKYEYTLDEYNELKQKAECLPELNKKCPCKKAPRF